MKRDRIEPPYKVYVLGRDGKRRPLDAQSIIVEIRRDIEIEIDFAPHPNFRGHLTMLTPPARRMTRLYDEGKMDDFAVFFGASNVLHVSVDRRMRRPAKGRGSDSDRKKKVTGPASRRNTKVSTARRHTASSLGRSRG
jgi:hypothetical protein